MPSSIRKYDARRISDPAATRDTHGQPGTERGDLRWLRQLDELTDGSVERLLVLQQPGGARVRLYEPASQEVDGDGEHGGDGGREEQPAHQRRHVDRARTR